MRYKCQVHFWKMGDGKCTCAPAKRKKSVCEEVTPEERRIRYFQRKFTAFRGGKAVLKIDHQSFSIGYETSMELGDWTRRQLAIALIRLVDKYRK